MNALTISYVIIALLVLLWVWFKYRKEKFIVPGLLIAIAIFALYSAVDAVFHTEIFSPFTMHKHGFAVSFVGVLLWLITSVIVGYLFQRYVDKRNKK